jgi:hypothetical protein
MHAKSHNKGPAGLEIGFLSHHFIFTALFFGLNCFHRQELCSIEGLRIDDRALEVLLSIHEPLDGSNHQNDEEGYDTVVHVLAGYWQVRWEEEENSRDNDICDTNL